MDLRSFLAEAPDVGERKADAAGDDPLPSGVRKLPLPLHTDARGSLFELYRESWGIEPRPRQWNVVRSMAHTVRGMHLHRVHHDVLVLVEGHMRLGVVDLRKDQPSYRAAQLLDLRGEAPAAVTIPPGVAHGFHFPVPSLHAYGLSVEWDPEADLDCRFDDPDLQLAWGTGPDVLLSERDRGARGLTQLLAALHELRLFGHGAD